jgi:plasmid stability protein
MASLTIRNLDERLKTRLRVRAASLGRSMEEEARNILRAALEEVQAPTRDLAERIRRRFADLGDINCGLLRASRCVSPRFRMPLVKHVRVPSSA